MTSKGGTKSEKRLSTSKARNLFRKEKMFTIKSHPGIHKRSDSVPLGFVLRDLLKVCNNLKEAKSILHKGNVFVDGKPRKEYKFPVGLFDVVSLKDLKKNYVAVFDSLGRIEFKEVKEGKHKICKVLGKRTVKKGKTQIHTNDSRTFREKVDKIKVSDGILIELPGQKILKIFELKNGNTVYVFGGTHVSTVATVKNIVEGTMKRPKLLTLEDKEGNEFQTTENNVVVVGDKKAELEVLE